MNKISAKSIAFAGVMTALLFVVLLLETYVFIFIIKPSPAFLSIPLAITLSVYGDKRKMFFGGTVFGLCSFVLAFIIGYTDFFNPLISVLPRIIMGVVAYGVCALCKKLFSGAKSKFVRETLSYSISGAFGVLTNTVLVLFMLFVFNGGNFTETALGVILSFNFLIEFVCGIILVPVLCKAVNSFLKRGR